MTSAVQDEGTTSTACNVALTLAHAGLSVCLIDADLRKPSVGGYFDLEGLSGLSELLSGNTSIDNCLRTTKREITVMTAGSPPSDPSALLGSSTMARLHEELRSRFDVLIINGPPVLSAPDAAVLASMADGAVLVVRQRQTTAQHVRLAIEALEAADVHLLGTVLTFVRGRRSSSMPAVSPETSPVSVIGAAVDSAQVTHGRRVGTSANRSAREPNAEGANMDKGLAAALRQYDPAQVVILELKETGGNGKQSVSDEDVVPKSHESGRASQN